MLKVPAEVWEREAHVHGCYAKAAPVTGTTLRFYWPRAGGLSAVNAISTQLHDPINSGLPRWRIAV